MKRNMKKRLAQVLLMLFPLLAASGLYAADVDVGNSNTGSGSINNATVTVVQALKVVIENDADIENDISLMASTGANEANGNTGDGTVASGDIDGSVEIVNEANVVELSELIAASDPIVPISLHVSNSETGANSVNTASFGPVTTTKKICILNSLNVANAATADMNTGNNDANGNTGDGSVTSGDISFAVAFATLGNTVNAIIGGSGQGGDEIVVPEDFLGVSSGDFAAAADFSASAADSLPVAGASGLVWMLILSAIVTLYLVEYMDRSKIGRLAR